MKTQIWILDKQNSPHYLENTNKMFLEIKNNCLVISHFPNGLFHRDEVVFIGDCLDEVKYAILEHLHKKEDLIKVRKVLKKMAGLEDKWKEYDYLIKTYPEFSINNFLQNIKS